MKNNEVQDSPPTVDEIIIIPAEIAFEYINDTSCIKCFKKRLNFLFGRIGSGDISNLRNVVVQSDRDYIVPSNVFEYITSCRGNFVGTTMGER